MRKAIIFLAVIMLASCKTVPIDPKPVDDSITNIETGAEKIQAGAQDVIIKTVEVEKVVERLVKITDGEAQKEVEALSLMIAELRKVGENHLTEIDKHIAEIERLKKLREADIKEIMKLEGKAKKYDIWKKSLITIVIILVLVALVKKMVFK